VDRACLCDFPNTVREVSVLRDLTVVVEFNDHGYDEGGPRYTKTYSEPEEVIAVLERYLGKPISAWENFTASGNYPPAPKTVAADLVRRFHVAVSKGLLALPEPDFVQRSGYWASVEKP